MVIPKRMRFTISSLLVTAVLLANLFVIVIVSIAVTQSRQQYENRAVTASQNLTVLLEKLIEDEIEKAIGHVFRRLSKGWAIPKPSSDRTYHLMAKAAVTVFEAADEEREEAKR